MKLEDQVCNLELAKRLKELGVKKESFAYWYKAHSGCHQLRIDRSDLGNDWEENKITSAFTVAELGEMIPRGFSSGRPFGKDLFECWPTFEAMSDDRLDEEQSRFLKVPLDRETKEADVRAKMLIYLLENKLVELNNQ